MSTQASSAKVYPYQDLAMPSLHHGVVAVTGSATIDLGIGHNNFDVQATAKGVLADLAPGHIVAWTYGAKPGQITFQVGKYSAGTWVAATAAVNIAFLAIARSSVG